MQSVEAISAECAALSLESSSTATSARQLACYNERLNILSDLLAGLISEREKLNNTLGNYSELALAPTCLLYTSPSPRDRQKSRMPSSA